MELAGGALIVIVLGIAVMVVVSSFVIHMAAKISGISHATFGKAVKACLACTVLSFIISAVFSIVPGIGTIIGFLISLFLTLLVLKSIYSTGWGRALLIWLMQWVVMIVIGLIMASLVGVSLL